jgi:Protein of unknown function (DUF4238)
LDRRVAARASRERPGEGDDEAPTDAENRDGGMGVRLKSPPVMKPLTPYISAISLWWWWTVATNTATKKNEKKRHHFVPITYLNKFSDGVGKIVAYRKDNAQDPLHLIPDAIAFEKYYYSQPLPEGGRDNNTLEDHFSTIETKWSHLVDQLRAGASLTQAELEDLYTFLGLMRVRVPALRDAIEVSLAEQVKAETGLLDRLGRLPPKPPGHEDILDHLSVSIDPHMSLHAMSHVAKGFGIVLSRLGFEVIHNKTDVTFITSDNPVVYFDPTIPEERVQPYQVRPPYGSIELLFPIDPETMLRGRTGVSGLRHIDLVERQATKRINRFIARFGYRFVFSRDRDHDALVAKYADISPVMQTVVIAQSEKSVQVNNGFVFGRRPIKPKWEPIAVQPDELDRKNIGQSETNE